MEGDISSSSSCASCSSSVSWILRSTTPVRIRESRERFFVTEEDIGPAVVISYQEIAAILIIQSGLDVGI